MLFDNSTNITQEKERGETPSESQRLLLFGCSHPVLKKKHHVN